MAQVDPRFTLICLIIRMSHSAWELGGLTNPNTSVQALQIPPAPTTSLAFLNASSRVLSYCYSGPVLRRHLAPFEVTCHHIDVFLYYGSTDCHKCIQSNTSVFGDHSVHCDSEATSSRSLTCHFLESVEIALLSPRHQRPTREPCPQVRTSN